jgi:hypothetical protein
MDRVAQGWLQRVAMATRPRLHTPLLFAFRFFAFAHHANSFGSAVGASTRDSGRKEVGPKIDPCAESDQSTSPLLSDRHHSSELQILSCLDAAQGHKNTRANTERLRYCAVHD